MDNVPVKLIRNCYYLYGAEGASFLAYPTPYAEVFRYQWLPLWIREINGHYPASHRGTVVLAFVVAFLWVALFLVKNCYVQILHLVWFPVFVRDLAIYLEVCVLWNLGFKNLHGRQFNYPGYIEYPVVNSPFTTVV